ncbi:DUF4064 domain-containing protein [Gemella haemolysans]|uniref:DUF4064 domain-containing protein n=1 Tax=Gemella haemolysans TaxID=1379 RepID=A0AAW6B3G2_9BACL|nr:DUF4064 domain-containing protein [Gemella haemolysans]MDB6185736.1 DUF4064 domain-containing protein [Gemella haemolysans]MDU4714843.1 DUF4064 domain-containing protein [Gemella haemolysans]
MKPFKRTVEKVLAWIANIILIVLTGVLAYGSFFKISVIKDNQEFLNIFKSELEKNPNGANLNGVNLSAEQIIDYTIQGLKMYSVLLIVLVVVALLATFLMKKRILSGILFLLLAIVIAIGTVGLLIPVYLFYFIVAIMLFVRKERPEEYQETVNNL